VNDVGISIAVTRRFGECRGMMTMDLYNNARGSFSERVGPFWRMAPGA